MRDIGIDDGLSACTFDGTVPLVPLLESLAIVDVSSFVLTKSDLRSRSPSFNRAFDCSRSLWFDHGGTCCEILTVLGLSEVRRRGAAVRVAHP